MSQSQKLLTIVANDIQQDCSDYLSLRDLLQELYQYLLERDAAQIEALNQRIVALAESAQVRAERRAKILGAFRLTQDAEGMQRILASYQPPLRDRLQQAWNELGQLAAECKRLNERNGKLLAMQHDILSQLLGNGSDSQLYTPQAY